MNTIGMVKNKVVSTIIKVEPIEEIEEEEEETIEEPVKKVVSKKLVNKIKKVIPKIESGSSFDEEDEHGVLTSIKYKYETKYKEKQISQFNTSALKTHA
jgi:hypothetical protein